MNIEGICIECEQKYEEGNKDIAATVRELETRVSALWDAVEWLRNGLLEIANGRDDMNPIYIKQQAQSILDGEPTTADEHNTMKEDEKLVYEDDMRQYEKDGLLEIVEFSEVNNIPENTVRISDVNKEIAEEWNRDREEKIRKESYEKSKEITEEDRKNYKKSMITSIGYRGEE
jgi:hypothetical protein